ncbi:MAG TPA: ribosome recycling factor [Methylomirabilota bacterium]|jgi:ribosome recycling factor|nr:ribosome recycling factor [Methylomirabilota bacterium]
MNAQVLDAVKKEMEHTVDAMRKELAKVRTGRASTSLIEGLIVEYYGARTPLNQLAALSAPEPRLLVVQPYDRSVMQAIEKAILQSDLGLTPINDGKVIRVPIPELTEERRKALVRHIRKVAEDYRVSARNHRRDANERLKKMQKEKQISEDEARATQERVQKLTDEYIEKLDKVLKAKEDELMAV